MSSYYSDILYPLQDRALRIVDKLQTPFYLTGGTALSRCYFNHRYSNDLDLFVNNEKKFIDLTNMVIRKLQERLKLEIITKTESFVSLKIEGVLKADFVNDVHFRYGNPEAKAIFSKVDNLENILSNKLSALISREEVKDVVDIWIIGKNIKVDWKEIFKATSSKAVGIFPPDVARKLVEFPTELLEKIKWVEGKKPDTNQFVKDLNYICDSMLAPKNLRSSRRDGVSK